MFNNSSSTSNWSLKTDIYLIVYIVQGLVLMASNFFILLTIARFKGLRLNKAYIVMAGLSLADGLSGTAELYAGAYRLYLIHTGQNTGLVSRMSCLLTVHNIVWIVSRPCQGMLLAVTSLDRLGAVAFPFYYYGMKPKAAYRMVYATYCYSLFHLAAATGLLWAQEDSTGPTVSPMCNTAWGLTPNFFRYHISVVTTGAFASIIIYGLVIIFYKKHQNKVHANGQKKEENAKMKRERKLTITLGVSCLFTLLFVGVPEVVTIVMHYLNYNFEVVSIAGFILSNLNPIMNIFIYGKRQKDLRKAMKALLKCKTLPQNVSLWQ